MMKFKNLLVAAALMAAPLTLALANPAHAQPNPTATQMSYAATHPGQASPGSGPLDSWVCTSATWWFDNDSLAWTEDDLSTNHFQFADVGVEKDEYELCGWQQNTVNQFALYDTKAGKYVGVNASAPHPLQAILNGGDTLAFFHLNQVSGFNCYMQFYNEAAAQQYVYTGNPPNLGGDQLAGRSTADDVFQFGAYPSTGDHC